MLCAESPLYGTFIPRGPSVREEGTRGEEGRERGRGIRATGRGREKDEGIGERLDGRDGEEREG